MNNMRTVLFGLFSCALVIVSGCNDNTTGAGESCTVPGWRCATPACSQFPTNPGCQSVAPTQGFCPGDSAHCFDPTALSGYCNPATGVCAQSIAGRPCPAKLCSKLDVMSCYTLQSDGDVFCRGANTCVPFSMGCPDAGAPVDEGVPDSGTSD